MSYTYLGEIKNRIAHCIRKTLKAIEQGGKTSEFVTRQSIPLQRLNCHASPGVTVTLTAHQRRRGRTIRWMIRLLKTDFDVGLISVEQCIRQSRRI